jgi:hypothetical protein
MTEEQTSYRPVRIELATSEIEGGSCRTWADPAQVLAVVARSQPEDAFARFVEPRLQNLAGGAGEAVAGGDGDSMSPSDASRLPAVVQALVRQVQLIHTRLFRENHSLMKTPCQVELTCALAHEDRVYFIRSAPSWVGILRQGQAYSASSGVADRESAFTPLGRTESLSLEVTSLAVQPGDTVVMLIAETDTAPDLHAVRNLFTQTPDLKRACDGLVNLQGLISPSAGAVALRFVSVESGMERGWRENPLEGLADEANWRQPLPMPSSLNEEVISSSSSSTSSSAPTASSFADRIESAEDGSLPDEDRSDPADRLPGLASALTEEEPGRFDEPNVRRRVGILWPALTGLAGVVLLLLVALPKMTGQTGDGRSLLERLRPGGVVAAVGSIEVDPVPPARAVLLDGQPSAEATPARVEAVSAGRHRIGLDLGPCGIWETEVDVPAGGAVALSPHLTGSVEVVTSKSSAEGIVWLEGREKVPVPTTLDSLPVGWTRLFFEDDRVPMWDRLVLVRVGETARVTMPSSRSTVQGVVRVEALHLAPHLGLVDSEGDSVWMDGHPVGVVPLEAILEPGLHSVRVGSSDDSYTEVLEVRAGSMRHVVAQLGRGLAPALRHLAPGRVMVRGPLLLSLEVLGGENGSGLQPTLHLPELPPGSRDIPLSPVDEKAGTYIGVVSPENLPVGRPIAYYFTVGSPSGETIWSDVYHLWVGNRAKAGIEGGAAPRSTASDTSRRSPSGG